MKPNAPTTVKKLKQKHSRAGIIRLLAVIGLCCLWATPGGSQQFNRIGYTVPIAQCYSPTAAASLGGEQNCQVDMYNACAGANAVQQNSGTGAYWHTAGYYMSTGDPNGLNGSDTLSAVAGYADVASFCSSIGAGECNYVASYTDVSGIAYQPGFYSTVSAASGAWYVVFAHEIGHNFGCSHADGLGGTNPFRTIMLHNYCSGSDISYYSNPSIYYNGIQLLGSLAQDCSSGSFVNNGNNAGVVALAAPGKQGARPAVTNTANAIFHWTFTNAPGAVAVGTILLDQFGKPLTVRGNGAVFTGTGLRLPGGTTGNTSASSIAAYLDLTNGVISTLTNMTLEIWATPISGQAWERLFSFGQMSGLGDGLGATGEWTGAPGTPAPGAVTAVDELALALAQGNASLTTEVLNATTNASASSINISVSTAPGTRHYYAMTFQDGVGAYGANGGRIICYRDDDGNPTSYLDVNFHLRNIHDVNAWLGRSQFASDSMANVEYSEVRISKVALTPTQIYGNYLLGGGNARTIFNPVLTAVHCGGAGVATRSADQRTFAADQNYSGGTAWNANGYSYTVDVSGVTNPAPQTAYQDQRYGNMTYTFNNYLPGTNYLVRLHCMECCWASSGKRVFNVFINGQKVLTNFDIYATAGAQNRAVIKEVAAVADANGRLVVGFSNVVDNASINAIEILQGGLFVPLNLTAATGSSPVALNWSPVTGATGYNVKRAIWSGGPYTTVGSSASTNYSDSTVTNGTTYYYVVSAVNGGSESFNSLEASVTPVSYDPNFSFENPSVGTYQYNPSGGAWTFTAQSGANGSGIAANASAFTSANPNSPDGVQVAYVQGIATISQVISNFVPGTSNLVTFSAAQRAVYVNGGQTWSLKINNVTVASFAPAAAATNYVSYSATFKASSTNQTVSFAGTDLHGGDNTIFLDKIRIQTVIPPVPTGLSATPGSNQVALIWNAASGATGYNLKRSLTSGSGYVTNASVAVTNYTDTLTTNGTMYYYVVSAVNAGGESANSVEVGARPVSVSLLPLNFSISPDGLSLRFNWPSDHTGWRLMMNTNDLGNSDAWFPVPNSAATNQVWLPFDATHGNVFFRLIYP